MDTEIIRNNKQIIALVFKKTIKADGVRFLTPRNYSLQLGLIEHPKGKIIKEHIHRKDIEYKVNTTQEFLFIQKGKVLIKLYSDKWISIKNIILTSGDFILFVSGGHGLKILSKSRIIEVKQGPYPGENNAKIYKDG